MSEQLGRPVSHPCRREVGQSGKPLSGLATDDVGQAKGGEGGECVDQISGGGGVTGGVKRCGHNATTASEARSGRKPKILAFAPSSLHSFRNTVLFMGVGCELSRACIVIVLRQKWVLRVDGVFEANPSSAPP